MIRPAFALALLLAGVCTVSTPAAVAQQKAASQALETSGRVVGQKIAWVPQGIGGFQRAYFEIQHLPIADHYRVSVWDYSFIQAAEAERP